MQAYLNVLKSYGPKALFIEIANSVLSRLGIVKIERLFFIDSLPTPKSESSQVSIKKLESSHLAELKEKAEAQVSFEDIHRVKSEVAVCFGAFNNGKLVGISWYALKPYHHGGGVYACFSQDWICGYGTWIDPSYRGLGIRPRIVEKAFEYANSIGRKGIIAAINWNNFASISSGLKIGYKQSGLRYWNKKRPYAVRTNYWLTWPTSKIATKSFDKPHAFITPFVNPALEVSFSTGSLVLVIDSAGSPSLEAWCKKRRLTYTKYNSKEIPRLLELMSDCQVQFLLSYAAPLLPTEVFTSPRLGTFNIHPSLLPRYRGGLPIFWQAFDGVDETGVTIHKVDEGIDTGEVILNRVFKVKQGESKGVLTNKYRWASASLLNDFLYTYNFDGKPCKGITPVSGKTRFAKNVTLKSFLSEFNVSDLSVAQLYRLTRYVGGWHSMIDELPQNLKNFKVVVVDYKVTDQIAKLGYCCEGSEHRYAVKDGYVILSVTSSVKQKLKVLRNKLKNVQGTSDIYL